MKARVLGQVQAVLGRRRMPGPALAAVALAATLSGCITVHGERVVVPATTKAEAAKVLGSFSTTNNKANREYDTALNATIETGALGAIDRAGLQARATVHPDGGSDYHPLKLTDVRYLIPRQAGWPKFFVADARSNRGQGRWLLVFIRHSVDAPWKAAYLAVIDEESVPEFTRDEHGYAEAVPTEGATGLAVAPSKLSAAYARYLRHGKGRVFAPGSQTDGLRKQRAHNARTPTLWNDFIDQPTKGEDFTAVGLRTEGGGALVFFSTYHHQKQTAAEGLKPPIRDEYAEALTTGTPERSITYTYVAGQAVTVPERGAEDERVAFLNRIVGLTRAKAE